ncbi:hypothetical protein [Cohnella fermenti]|uniref:Uncharacterized protein n=1 Tax=Cohnella fermenti TaxID=2565925 RepID=A0A4S4C706_9BACL|nr:hypothetical protein [Cohnella fermenti]THF83718.1 hypothetical protein E6C55_03235 [Cohnella fermenti]
MHLKRIAYYTRKAAQYSALRRSWPHRFNRIMRYKAALNKRLQEERLRWRPAIELEKEGANP